MANAAAIASLCPACGLCCDSTLFADVELRARDDAKQLIRLGFRLEKKGKSKLAFAQPCPGFDGQWCRIYAERPQRCRQFDCGLLQRVAAGELTPAAARKKIIVAKQRSETVRNLLRRLGQNDERWPLTHRYAEAMSAPVDLSVADQAETHGELMLAVSELMHLLQRDFLR